MENVSAEQREYEFRRKQLVQNSNGLSGKQEFHLAQAKLKAKDKLDELMTPEMSRMINTRPDKLLEHEQMQL